MSALRACNAIFICAPTATGVDPAPVSAGRCEEAPGSGRTGPSIFLRVRSRGVFRRNVSNGPKFVRGDPRSESFDPPRSVSPRRRCRSEQKNRKVRRGFLYFESLAVFSKIEYEQVGEIRTYVRVVRSDPRLNRFNILLCDM